MSTLAATFRALHQNTTPLRLANAWDIGSACQIESLGAPAIATTSAGVAWALGYADGNAVPIRELANLVAAITRRIKVPLTVDSEGGYADTPEGAAENIAGLVDAGAVGINIEDGTGAPDLLAAKVERIRRTVAGKGVDLFVNVRIDVYLKGLVPEAQRLDEVLTRAKRYRDAGADGIFVPGLVDPAGIRQVVAATPLPVNLLAWQNLPPAAELGALGVRRLSAGSAIIQTLWGQAAAMAKAFLAEGQSAPVIAGAMPFAEINKLFL